jgi:uncharacterized membrane protein
MTPLARLQALRERLRASLGFLPAVGVTLAVLVGVALPQWEQGLGGDSPLAGFAFGGSPDAARSVLSAIAGSVITVTSLTFSLTVVTLQLASSQFSPRLLRTFVRDRLVQGVLAVFLATFVYALVVLRTVRTESQNDPGFVPRISVTLAIVLAVVAAGGLVTFLAHITSLMRVDTLMRDVHSQTRQAMDLLYPPDELRPTLPGEPTGEPLPLVATTSGWIQAVDVFTLAAAAERAGLRIHLDVGVGDHLVEGVPIGTAWSVEPHASVRVDDVNRALQSALTLGYERTPQFDVNFGFRQIVDIAAKALSPGVNDPTTAVHALGHLAALVVAAARRPLGPQAVRDVAGRVRLVVRRPDFPELLALACAQPRQFGAGQPPVVLAVLEVLEAAAWAVMVKGDPGRRAAVLLQLTQLEDAVEREVDDPRDLVEAGRVAARVRDLLATTPRERHLAEGA